MKHDKPGNVPAAPYKPPRGMVPFTQARMDTFLKDLAEFGLVNKACRAAGVTYAMVYRCRERDEGLMQAWDEALATYGDSLEVEADRRGKDGVIVGKYYQGTLIAKEKVYSDHLLEVMLKKTRPAEFRENQVAALSIDAGVLIVGRVAASDQEWLEKHGGRRAVEADHEDLD